MKYIVLIALLAVALAFGQGAPSYSAVDAVYDWRTEILSSFETDTLAVADSSTITSKKTIEPGREYILQRNAFSGTGSDSVSVYLRSDLYDYNDTLIYSTVIDSFTASAGEAVILPWNRTQFGAKGTLKIIGYGDDGGQLITNYWAIVKRIAINKTTGYTGSFD